MKDIDIVAYTNRFKDLSTLFHNYMTPEYEKMERCISGLVQPIKGLVTASRPSTYDSSKRLAFNLTNQEIRRGNMVQRANLQGSRENK